MKLKMILPWVLVLGLTAGFAAVYVKSNAKDAELTRLRDEVKEVEQLRADAASAQEKAQVPEDQVLVPRKDKEELIRLRGEVGKLRADNQKFTKDIAALQSRADAAKALADETRTQAAQQAQANAVKMASMETERRLAATDPVRVQNACINNLRQLDAAKQQWALENNKTANSVPTGQDLAPYLRNNLIPTCPAGGVYTANAVGQAPTCSTPGHVLQ